MVKFFDAILLQKPHVRNVERPCQSSTGRNDTIVGFRKIFGVVAANVRRNVHEERIGQNFAFLLRFGVEKWLQNTARRAETFYDVHVFAPVFSCSRNVAHVSQNLTRFDVHNYGSNVVYSVGNQRFMMNLENIVDLILDCCVNGCPHS